MDDIEQNDISDYDSEKELGVCENCGEISEVFESEKDGKKYCLKGC